MQFKNGETYYRVDQIIGTDRAKPRKAHPPHTQKQDPHYEGILPISRTLFFQKVRTGELPKPIKLGSRTAVWPLSELVAKVEAMRAPTGVPTPPTATSSQAEAPALTTKRGPGRPRKAA